MAQASSIPVPSPAATGPSVRLEVRARNGRPTSYEVGDGGFLIGAVAGCDLRLAGTELAPVLCLITKHLDGVTLRKLAPMQQLTVNGQTVIGTILQDGDHIGIGGVEIVAAIAAAPDERSQNLEQRRHELEEQAEQLQRERTEWRQRKADIEQECQRQQKAAVEMQQRLRREERELAEAKAGLSRRPAVDAAEPQPPKEYQDVVGLRQELNEIKQQLVQKFQQRKQRLQIKETAIRRAALRIQERKRRLDARETLANQTQQDWPLRQAELDARSEQYLRERKLLEEQARTLAGKQRDMQREVGEKLRDLEMRETKLADERRTLDASEKLHQADLVRRDRLQAMLEQRQKQLQMRALEIDRRFEQMQRDSRDLEEQAKQLDEWHARLASDTEKLMQQKKDQELTVSQIDQRAAVLEGQQAMLATLRTRLERMRDELRREEQVLAEQRTAQELNESQIRQRAQENEQQRKELEAERLLIADELRQRETRQAMLDSAVAQLRQARESLSQEEEQLRHQREQVDATAAQQMEQAGLLLARGTQMEEVQRRLEVDRQSLREREDNLSRTEQALAALQDQVRKRSEELNEQQKKLFDDEKRLQDEAARLTARGETLTLEHRQALERVEAQQQELTARENELTALRQQTAEQQSALEIASQELAAARRGLVEEQEKFAAERQAATALMQRTRTEVEAAQAEAKELAQSLPELEQRGAGALERLVRGRELLGKHLEELHGFTKQSRKDIETARTALQAEIERLRQQESSLHTARDEHRLAVAAFRQQLLEWQGHIAEIKQSLQQSESRIHRRQAEIEEKDQVVSVTSARLARQAEDLVKKERVVAERRGEVDRHLVDMREWYRKKMRELAGIDAVPPDGDAVVMSLPSAATAPAASADSSPAAEAVGTERGILSLTAEVDPGDRKLGELLRSLELVDADTLAALLLEARRQRRSLRQLLLAGNYLTLYQIALIEAGNLHGLVLGPVRVIDRLQATPHEAVYRVFDPRGNREALLRHLAEAEMFDAVRPDEFRQRFAAVAAVQHPQLAATYEVLEINNRPAVLQEWLNGVPSSEWAALAAAPGVWHRLLAQAAVALATAHGAGLLHGHLELSSFVLSGDGVLKLCGLGEPRWLAVQPSGSDNEVSAAHDLAALGRVAAEWSSLAAPRKTGKGKPLPEPLQRILQRLTSDKPEEQFASAAALVEALEQIRAEIPANATAWERFVKQAREQSTDVALRESA